jgi:hypothetical protein
MKFGISLIALFALCQPAVAQTSDCQSIQKASDRLACYDRASPPLSLSKSSTKHKTATQQDGQGDFLADETTRVGKKIGNICRGC